MCLIAIFGAAGLSVSVPAGWMPMLTLASLGLLLLALGMGAARRHTMGPLVLGLAAIAAVLVGKYRLDSNTVMFAGMGLLAAASLWNGWPRKQETGPCGTACEKSQVSALEGAGLELRDGL